MEIGLHVADFTWPGGAPELRGDLRDLARAAEDAGLTKLSVMDHVWQIGSIGPPEHEMLEAYTTLGYLAGVTERIELLAWVTAVVYREPGLLAKCVTTLDVLSGGRAWLGIGAAWNHWESAGLGLPFPPTAERFERLEEALQICLQMWSDSEEPYEGKHYRLARTLNSPKPLRRRREDFSARQRGEGRARRSAADSTPRRPRPPILIGGGGERKTLRLVAQYADACNLFDTPELPHKLDVLRRHCDEVGRDYDEITKTVMKMLDLGPHGEQTDEVVASLRRLAALGITHVHTGVISEEPLEYLELLGRRVVPAVTEL